VIEIPTNKAGKFEAVTIDGGVVVGTGTVVEGLVTFEHDGAHGSPPQRVELPLAEFASTWEALPQSNHIELRAAS